MSHLAAYALAKDQGEDSIPVEALPRVFDFSTIPTEPGSDVQSLWRAQVKQPGHKLREEAKRLRRSKGVSLTEPLKPTESPSDFSYAAQLALEAAQRNLILEHGRVLAAREAKFCREIAHLRKELSAMRASVDAGDGPLESEKNSAEELDSRWEELSAGQSVEAEHVSKAPPQRGKSWSQLSWISGGAGHENRVTWKKTADSMICKASVQFLRSPTGVELKPSLRTRLCGDRAFQTKVMESFIGCVIVLNTITVGISSELYPMWTGWLYFDMAFAAVFSFEFVIKVYLLGASGYACGHESRWNNFEVLLVLLAYVEILMRVLSENADSDMSMLFRMLRLLRLVKLVRILRLQVFRDLLMMVNGAIGSWKTLLYSMVLICIPLYGVSMVLKEMLGSMASLGQGAEKFQNLHQAFFTLFRCFVVGDCTQEDGKPLFVLVTNEYGWYYGMIYCLVQFLMTFGLYNVIVAIYVENTVSAARFNERERLRDRNYFENKAQNLLRLIWNSHFDQGPGRRRSDFNLEEAGHLELSQDFFEDLCTKQDFIDILRDLDISEDDQLDLFETLDVEGRGSIELIDFVIGIGKLRGQARKADVVSVSLILRSLHHKMMQVEAKLNKMQLRSSGSIGRKSTSTRVSTPLGAP